MSSFALRVCTAVLPVVALTAACTSSPAGAPSTALPASSTPPASSTSPSPSASVQPTPAPVPADAYCAELRKAGKFGLKPGSSAKAAERAKYINQAVQLAPPELAVWLSAATQVFLGQGQPDPATVEFVYFELDSSTAQVAKDCGFEFIVPR